MKRLFLTLALALMLGLAFSGGASADDHLTPGTPGTSNCQGQTTAYLAQAAKNGLLGGVTAPGLGNLADAANLTVQQIHDVVATYCGS